MSNEQAGKPYLDPFVGPVRVMEEARQQIREGYVDAERFWREIEPLLGEAMARGHLKVWAGYQPPVWESAAEDAPVAPAIQPERTESQMSDERLDEIEQCMCYEPSSCCDSHRDLVAEVRRLRRENHLLSLSRGVPLVGQG